MTNTLDILPDILGEPASHSKQSLRLWLRLLTCSNFIEKRIRHLLKSKFDTTLPRFDVLAALDRATCDLSMSQLSALLMVSNGNVTAIISRLEEEGLVTRSGLPNDRRTHVVSLSQKGRKLFRKMAKSHEFWLDEMLSEVSDEEIQTLLELLATVKYSSKAAEIRG